MMGKISKFNAQNVARAAAKAAFEKELAASDEKEIVVGLQIYESLFNGAETIEAENFPYPAWIDRNDNISINAGGWSHCFSLGKDYVFPASETSTYHLTNQNLIEYVQSFLDNRRNLRARRDGFEQQLTRKISACSSWSTLERLWPEGKEFYARYANAPATSTTLVSFADVNELMKKEHA